MYMYVYMCVYACDTRAYVLVYVKSIYIYNKQMKER